MTGSTTHQYQPLQRLTDLIQVGLLKKVTSYFKALDKYKPNTNLTTAIVWTNDLMGQFADAGLGDSGARTYPYLFIKYEDADDWDMGYTGSTLSRHHFVIKKTDQVNIKLKVLPEMYRATMTLYTDDINQAKDFATLLRHAKHNGSLSYSIRLGDLLPIDIRVSVTSGSVQFPEKDNAPEQINVYAIPINLVVYGFSALPFAENDLVTTPLIKSIVVDGNIVSNANEITADELEVIYPDFSISVAYDIDD